MPKVGDLGEFGMIAKVTEGLAMPPSVSVGPGDDAACFLLDGSAVVSTDMYVEGTHFRTEWSDAGDIGRKVVAASVADIEAMGAVPVTLLVALACRATPTRPGSKPSATASAKSASARASPSSAAISQWRRRSSRR